MNDDLTSRRRDVVLAAVAIAVLALIARFGFIARNGALISPDSTDYTRLAENVRAQGVFSLDTSAPFSSSIRRPPVYPGFLLAFVQSGKVSTRGAVIGQAIVDAGVAVLVLQLALLAFNLRYAVLAGLLYAIHPGAIYSSASILSESLFTALSVGGVLAAVWGRQRNYLSVTALGGVASALRRSPVLLPCPFLSCLAGSRCCYRR